ncbi:hypothetical protein KSF_098370 [Reticulibacter mediterranei]|uniref:HTH arsR-type domain-containing protein n=1 Tax=Reticulibacter mediterranei TaxID=2778369 RepID=A0A8J3N649_9CHLR|nr:hypothetical protein KSF_098370 [Reticulibacter mediterranei]
MTDEHAQRVFLALADPTRRLLLQQLCEEGSGTAVGFATRLPITRQAIIKHPGCSASSSSPWAS